MNSNDVSKVILNNTNEISYKNTQRDQLLTDIIDNGLTVDNNKNFSTYADNSNVNSVFNDLFNIYNNEKQARTSSDIFNKSDNIISNYISDIPQNKTSGEILPLENFQEIIDYFSRITSSQVLSRSAYVTFIKGLNDPNYARPFVDYITWEEFSRKNIFYDDEVVPPVLKIKFTNKVSNPVISVLVRNIEIPYRRFWINSSTAIYIYPEYLFKCIPLNTIIGLKSNFNVSAIEKIYMAYYNGNHIKNISDGLGISVENDDNVKAIEPYSYATTDYTISNLHTDTGYISRIRCKLSKFTPDITYDDNLGIIMKNYSELVSLVNDPNIEFTPLCLVKHNRNKSGAGKKKKSSKRLFRISSIANNWFFSEDETNTYDQNARIIANSYEFINNYRISENDLRYRRYENMTIVPSETKQLNYVFIGLVIGVKIKGNQIAHHYNDYILSRRSINSVRVSSVGEHELKDTWFYE